MLNILILKTNPQPTKGLIHKPQFVRGKEREQILDWLKTLHPIWEMRYSKHNPPPPGSTNRQLLRPVYWLGNWQFACLNYYHPPKGIENRCIKAEWYPPSLQPFVQQAESIVRENFGSEDVPRGWHLNTCLINFYGDKIDGNNRIDCARVGEHKDFELGPVVSLSFGEKALFQFVKSDSKQGASVVTNQAWLGDGDLQIFGGHRFKRQLFHRVQRVDRKMGFHFPLPFKEFDTRRINFTFRYVPNEHILRWKHLPESLKQDTLPYMQELAKNSSYFRDELAQNP